MNISVLLVDDHAMFRKGLQLLLAEEPDMNVVGEAGDGREAIAKAHALTPDVVVMDITMPNLNGIEATREILSKSPDTKVVALSIHTGKHFVTDMLAAGAAGYIAKDNVPEELIKCIRKVMRNEVYLSSEITGVVVSCIREGIGSDGASETPDLSAIMLENKVRKPPIVKSHIHRPALLKRLQKGLPRPLTLVSAPAGYGKTTLVSCWLQTCEIPSAWVSLDEGDNDLQRFLRYLVAAVRTIFPEFGSQTLKGLDAPKLTPVKVLADALTREVDRMAQPFVMVLDDVHEIKDSAVLTFFNHYLHHPSGNAHLVLIGRRDPSLPIASLRAQDLISEIRTRDLRFNEEETATFLEQALGAPVDNSSAAALVEKTEGWVTALHLATLSMRHRGVIDPVSHMPQADSQYVREYLFTEVLSGLPTEISRCLLGAAILDCFCAPLCEAVCLPGTDPPGWQPDGWAFVAWLKNENIFIVPLDAENRWFRFHHLFKQLLLSQLRRHFSNEDIKALHAKASAWFAENDMIEKALDHAIEGENSDEALQLVTRHGFELMNDQKWPLLQKWIEMLPSETIDQNPELLVLDSWLQVIHSRYPELISHLKQAERLLSSRMMEDFVKGHLEALLSFRYYQSNEAERAIDCARRAYRTLPRDHRWARAFTTMIQAAAHQMNGDHAAALALVKEAMRHPDMNHGASQIFSQANSCFIFWVEADLRSMMQTAAHALKTAEAIPTNRGKVQGHYFLGIAHYHRNSLQSAEEHLLEVIRSPKSQPAMTFAHGAFALALTYQARHQMDDANRVANSVVAHALEIRHPALLEASRAFQVELALRQGFLAQAIPWAKKFVSLPFEPMRWFYVPHMTLAKVLLAQNTNHSRKRAADLLQELYDFVIATHNTRFLIDILVLQALCHHLQKDESAATAALKGAFELAEPNGFIRVFVDQGPQMADLLERVPPGNVAVDYIEAIKEALEEDTQRILTDAAEPVDPSAQHNIFQPLLEPLTVRELEILEMLAQRLRNKEIADQLNISTETVKKHLGNIYGKLGTHKRLDAVEKALALGILSRR